MVVSYYRYVESSGYFKKKIAELILQNTSRAIRNWSETRELIGYELWIATIASKTLILIKRVSF